MLTYGFHNRLRFAPKRCIQQFVVGSISVLAFGCFGSAGSDTVRPDLAKETLITALSAWKDGKTMDVLQSQSPAIVVQDMDWTAGKQLQEFALQGDGKPVGANLSIEVELTFGDTSDEMSQQKVWYLVGTDPALTVFRDMLH
jgi:hypothetical protein